MKTPCIRVCTLTPDGRECTGCKRTPAEIADWSSMSEDKRESIMKRCLGNAWGSKCRDCLDYSKHDLAEQQRKTIDDLGEALW